MTSEEIEPWVVLLGGNGAFTNAAAFALHPQSDDNARADSDPSLAMWQLREGEQPALALFSDETKAGAYARQIGARDYQLLRPTRTALVSIFIQYYQQQVRLAVLDPDECGARRIFNMRDCLKAARDQLVSLNDLLK